MQKQSNGKPLIPYIRQSRKKEETISLDDQRRAIEAWASANGASLADEVVEHGVSGNKSWRVRELGRVLEACQKGEAQGVIVAFQDRLSREDLLGTAEVWTEFGEARARIVACDGVDSALEGQRLLYVVKAEIARQQWERYEVNGENGRRAAIEKGKYVGQTPAGYERDEKGRLHPHPEHAPVIRELFRLRAGGMSQANLTRFINEAGVPTSRGSLLWSEKAVAKLLHNEAYLGVARSGPFRNEEAHEPLIEKAVWRRVQARKGTKVQTKRQEKALLTGLLRCASCGNTLQWGWTTREGRRHDQYRCRNYGVCQAKVAIGANAIEAYVLEWVAAQNVRLESAPKGPDVSRVEADLEAAEIELLELVQSTGLDVAVLSKSKQALAVDEARKAFERAAAGEGPAVPSERPATVEGLLLLPVEVQRAILAELLDKIGVSRGHGFDRVTLHKRV